MFSVFCCGDRKMVTERNQNTTQSTRSAKATPARTRKAPTRKATKRKSVAGKEKPAVGGGETTATAARKRVKRTGVARKAAAGKGVTRKSKRTAVGGAERTTKAVRRATAKRVAKGTQKQGGGGGGKRSGSTDSRRRAETPARRRSKGLKARGRVRPTAPTASRGPLDCFRLPGRGGGAVGGFGVSVAVVERGVAGWDVAEVLVDRIGRGHGRAVGGGRSGGGRGVAAGGKRATRGRTLATKQRIDRVSAVCAALGHPLRMAILVRLFEGPATYRDLQGHTRLAAGPLYHHVNQLRLAGLILPKKRDRYAMTRGGRNAMLVALAMTPLTRDERSRVAVGG